jgi:hypothetical protein
LPPFADTVDAAAQRLVRVVPLMLRVSTFHELTYEPRPLATQQNSPEPSLVNGTEMVVAEEQPEGHGVSRNENGGQVRTDLPPASTIVSEYDLVATHLASKWLQAALPL